MSLLGTKDPVVSAERVHIADSELDDYWFVPTETSGKRANDSVIQCVAYSYEEVTRTLEGALR